MKNKVTIAELQRKGVINPPSYSKDRNRLRQDHYEVIRAFGRLFFCTFKCDYYMISRILREEAKRYNSYKKSNSRK